MDRLREGWPLQPLVMVPDYWGQDAIDEVKTRVEGDRHIPHITANRPCRTQLPPTL